MEKEWICIENICKSFHKNLVLDHIHASFYHGEICSVLGENGSGKSTLMKILAGIYQPDEGRIFIHGEEKKIETPRSAMKLGISMIMQEPALAPSLSVEHNIFLGNEICHGHTPFVNRYVQQEKIEDVFQMLEVHLDLSVRVDTLTLLQKRMIELARAIVFESRMIIMDEITASFSSADVQKIFSIIRKLKQMGITTVFISHKLHEVREISERVLILRDGKLRAQYHGLEGENIPQVIKEMAGIDYRNRYPKARGFCPGRILLRAEGISNEHNTVKDVSLSVRSGEIVGLAGLQGAGKTSLARLLNGADAVKSGKVYLEGQPVVFKRPSDAVKKGVTFMSGISDENLFQELNIFFNVTIMNLKRVQSRTRFLHKDKIVRNTYQYIKRMHIQNVDPNIPVKYLSGGSKQKIAFSKLHFSRKQMLILDDPSVGLDIASKVELYNMMNAFALQGHGILFISSDLRELIGMCDRIYVIYDGKIQAELNGEEATSLKILMYASGSDGKACF